MLTFYAQLGALLISLVALLVLDGPWAVAITVLAQAGALVFTFVTLRHKRQQKLAMPPAATAQAVREYSQSLIDGIPFPVYIKDAQGTIVLINKAQERQWQYEKHSTKENTKMVGKPSYVMNSNSLNRRISREEDEDIIVRNTQVAKEELYTNQAGEVEYRYISKRRFMGLNGDPQIACVKFDLTQQRNAEMQLMQKIAKEKELRERTTQFIQRVIDVIPDPFYIKSELGFFVMVNEAYARYHGLAKEELTGQLITIVQPKSAELSKDTYPEDMAVLKGEEVNKDQYYLDPHTGKEKFRHVSKRLCLGMDGEKLIVVAHFDITPWKMAEREIQRLASTDELTKLHNRRSFDSQALHLSSLAKRHGQALSVMILDIDHFKAINDTYGHPGGDAVLQHLGDLLLRSLRTEDVACRWGGEEFVVLLPMVDAQGALELGNRLRTMVEDMAIAFQDRTIGCTISGGVAQWLPHEDLAQCLARADLALYASKSQGRNRMTLADTTAATPAAAAVLAAKPAG